MSTIDVAGCGLANRDGSEVGMTSSRNSPPDHLSSLKRAARWYARRSFDFLGPGRLVTSPVVARNADGRLEVFAGTYGRIWHIWQESESSGPWSNWAVLDSPGFGRHTWGGLAIATEPDGRLHLFAQELANVDTASSIWHIEQTRSSNGWGNWQFLGGPLGAPAAMGGLGGMSVIAGSFDGGLRALQKSGAFWTESRLGGVGFPVTGESRVGLVRNSDGHLELFATDASGGLWHSWQSGGGAFGGLERWPATYDSPPTLGRNLDGNLEVFLTSGEATLWHSVQRLRNDSQSWGNMSPIGVSTGGRIPYVSHGQNIDGRLEVFAEGDEGYIGHKWQTVPNVDTWTPQTWRWYPMDDKRVFWPFAVALNKDGRLEIFTVPTRDLGWWDQTHRLYHKWQREGGPDYGWSNWDNLGCPDES